MYILDTSLWIYSLRKETIIPIKNKVDLLLSKNMIAIINIIKLELLSGIRNEVEFNKLKDRLNYLPEIEITEHVWEKAYEIAFKLRKNDLTIPVTDIIISAAALISDYVVFHADAHYELISKHTNLKTRNFLSYFNKIT